MNNIIFAVVILFLILIGPIAVIYSLNTLFALGIPLTFKTWLATFVLCGVFNVGSGSKD